ncbi:MAG TPA: LptF/LptG family permease [Terriglobia bacterium]|nr:LptF/LptG family permease [Terriglobia bacterium]
MRLIDLYILKRVSWPLVASIAIAMSGLLMERLIRLLDLFANRGGPLSLIMKMLGYLVPHYLAVAIPAAFFVGILYASLRLSSDSELDALRATGMSLGRILVPIASMACVLTVICAILLGFLQPYTRYAYRALVYLITETSWNSAIERGAFFNGFGGKTILIGDIAAGGHQLSQIFIKDSDSKGDDNASTESDPTDGSGSTSNAPAAKSSTTHTIITAPTGDLTNDPRDFSVVLKMMNGYRVEISDDGATSRSIKFDESSLPLEAVSPTPFRQRGDKESEMTFVELLKSYRSHAAGLEPDELLAEINYRIVRSLSVLFLPFLALPLGLSSRRSPRNIRLLAGIVFLITYYQVLEFGSNLVQHGKLSSFVALWLPFFLFAAPSLWLFHAANRRVGQDPLAQFFEAVGDRCGDVVRRGRRLIGLETR